MERPNEKTSFHHRLDQKIIEAGLSYRELSLRIGKGETYIATLVRNRNDPGLSTVVDICNALKIGLADLLPDAGPAATSLKIGEAWQVEDIAEEILVAVAKRAHLRDIENGSNPTLDEIFDWWHRQGGRLENFDQLREHIDLFTPPSKDASMPVPARLGNNSLVARTFGVEDEDNLRHLLNHLDTKLNMRIARAHSEALCGRPVLSIEQLDVRLPDQSLQIKTKYKRLLLPVHDLWGNSYVLNYAQIID